MRKLTNEQRSYRRELVVKFHQEGKNQVTISHLLDMSQGYVSRIIKLFNQKGPAGLAVYQHQGALPRLSEEQLQQLPSLLEKGPLQYGFQGEIWTRKRVGRLITDTFQISYSPRQVGNLLEKVGYSLQKPKKRLSTRSTANASLAGATA